MQAVLLAAGESSRFWPLAEGKHKSLMSLMGAPLIVWTLRSLESSGIKRVVIVQSPSGIVEHELSHFSFNLEVQFVVQGEPRGMGDALLAASKHLEDEFFLLHAHQFIANELIPDMIKLKASTGAELVLSGQRTDHPERYGVISLNGHRAMGIVEKPARENAPSDVRALGVYLLNRKFVDELNAAPSEHYALETALDSYMNDHHVSVHMHERETISFKYPWDLFTANRILMDRHLKEHRAESAQISPLAHIDGTVHIGEGAKIYEYAVIKGPCYLGDGCVIGTHAIVRDYANLESGAVVGAHGEAARSIFQQNATTHSGFFGDSIFDKGAKIGAGTVTANVKVHRDEIKTKVKDARIGTGRTSLGVIVGESTQLGISVSTMPGVLIGARSFVGPNAIVESNVSSDSRVMVKQEQLTKEKRSRA